MGVGASFGTEADAEVGARTNALTTKTVTVKALLNMMCSFQLMVGVVFFV
jgi:hypothetical protein